MVLRLMTWVDSFASVSRTDMRSIEEVDNENSCCLKVRSICLVYHRVNLYEAFEEEFALVQYQYDLSDNAIGAIPFALERDCY